MISYDPLSEFVGLTKEVLQPPLSYRRVFEHYLCTDDMSLTNSQRMYSALECSIPTKRYLARSRSSVTKAICRNRVGEDPETPLTPALFVPDIFLT